jgi:DNA-directed RNA polymerase subunit K/omega
LLLAIVLTCVPRPAAAQGADDPAYRKTTDEAVREFEAGHWEEARALFKRAHEISPNARTLRGMGMAAFEMRMYVQAIRELDAALREQRKALDAELRAQVQQLMDKAREFVGRVRLVLDPPQAKVLIDGKEPQLEADGSVLLDVGTHVIGATADRCKPTNMRLAVEGGMDQGVRVALEPLLGVDPVVPAIDANHPPPASATNPPPGEAPPPRAEPAPQAAGGSNLITFAWVALAGAGAFGIASGVFKLVSDGQYKDTMALCQQHCSDQQINDSGVKTSDMLTTVFLGVAAASGATAIVLFAVGASSGGGSVEAHTSSQHAPRAAVSLHALPTGLVLKGKF